MKIQIFLSYFLVIIHSLKITTSDQEQINSLSAQDYSIILYLNDILKDNKIVHHEESIHNERIQKLKKQQGNDNLFEEELKIDGYIDSENERHRKTLQLILKKIIRNPIDVPAGTPVSNRPNSLTRPFSPSSSDEDNE